MNGDDQIAAIKLFVAGAPMFSGDAPQFGAGNLNKMVGAVNDLIAQANRIVEIRNAGPKAKVYTDGGSVIFDMDLDSSQYGLQTLDIGIGAQDFTIQLVGLPPVPA